MRLENKVVLISGGASGIGAETARRVVREGGKAVLADRDEAKGRALASELGASAAFAALDVTDETAWQKAVAAAVDSYGGLHGLLNAAGIGVRNSIEDCSLEEYRRVNDVNSMGTFLGCKSAIPAMARSGGGSIVNISSVSGEREVVFHNAAYGASKAGMTNLTRVAALEFGGDKIRVNAVLPGGTATEGAVAASKDMVQRGLELKGPMTQPGRVPLGMMGNPGDIAAACLFFASPASKQITGQSLAVDGGFLVS